MFCGCVVAQADLPVEAGTAGDLLDTGAGETDVVAALVVVVVVAGLSDQDVVAGRVARVLEEQVAGVALQEVGLVAALDPVVARVAEDGVEALTGDHEVVAGSGKGLVDVGATVGEVVAVAGHG